MSNLPTIGGSFYTWGNELNTWLTTDHNSVGRNNPTTISYGNVLDTSAIVGKIVYRDSTTGTYFTAIADGSVKQNVVGIVKSLSDNSILISGVADFLTGLTPGNTYYLSDTTAGVVTSIQPADNAIRIGNALSSTSLLVQIDNLRSDTSLIEVNSLGASSPLKLVDLLSDTLSSGWIEGTEIVYQDSTSVGITAGEILIRTANTVGAPIYYAIIVNPIANIQVPVGTPRLYVYLTYNNGVIEATTSVGEIIGLSEHTNVMLGDVHNVFGMEIHNDSKISGDFVRQASAWLSALVKVNVASGETVSDPASPSRKLMVTAGDVFDSHFRRRATTLFNSNATDTFSNYYRDSTASGGWAKVQVQTNWDNQNWDNNSGTLQAMTTAYYANLWLVRGFVDSDISILYGQAQYLLASDAQAENQPTQRPVEIDNHGIFIAQLTFQKGGTSPYSIKRIVPVLRIDSHLADPAPHSGHELLSNKDTDGTLTANSDTKYTSQKAVKTYVDTGLGNKQNSLGFTPENVANKTTDGTLAANSDTLYPSEKAVKTYADTKAPLAAPTITGTASFAGQIKPLLEGDQFVISHDTSKFREGSCIVTTVSGGASCGTTNGNKIITDITSTANLSAGMLVTSSGGTGAVGAAPNYITSVDSATQVTVSVNSTATGTTTATFTSQLYSLLGGSAAFITMKYWSHNLNTDVNGNWYTGRDETEAGYLRVITEGNLDRTYALASGTAGVPVVAADFTLHTTINNLTGVGSSGINIAKARVNTSSRYHTAIGIIASPTTLALSANTLYYVPICITKNTTLTSLAIHVSASTSGNVRLGIYNTLTGNLNNGGTLVLDAGTVSLVGTGFKSLAISQYLLEGTYILALLPDTIATVYALTDIGSALNLAGFNNTFSAYTATATSVAQAYGSGLPTTAPSPTTSLAVYPIIGAVITGAA